MKKILIFLFLITSFFASFSQVTTWRLGIDSASGNPKLYRDTVIGTGTAAQHLVGGTVPHWVDTAAAGGSGTVTDFSAGDLSPLFTTSEATTTTTPALSFAISNAAAFTLLGRGSGTGAYSFLSSIDSNWIPDLHSEAYYNTKYAAIGGSGSGWSLTGNAAIAKSTNFMGSTDSSKVYFKQNATTQLILDTLNTVLGGTAVRATTRDTAFLQLPHNGVSWRAGTATAANNAIAQFKIYVDTLTGNNGGFLTIQGKSGGSNAGFSYREGSTQLFKVTTAGIGTFSAQMNAATIRSTNTSGTVLDTYTSGSGAATTVLSNNIYTGAGGLIGSNSSSGSFGWKFQCYLTSAYVDRWWMWQNGHFSNSGTDVATALVNFQSTTEGVLLPRMTKAQRDAIVSPATGLMIYQTDNTPGLRVWNATNWVRYTETND